MPRHTSPALHITPGDGRHMDQIEMAERVLKLEDPIDARPPALAELLHPNQAHWPDQARQALHSHLAPWRVNQPIEVPSVGELKRLICVCISGLDGDSWDASPGWHVVFGTAHAAFQNRLRALFHGIRSLNYPVVDDRLFSAIAEHLIATFNAAAEQQKARLEKREREKGPIARAQAAAAVLEHVGPLQAALLAFDAATRDGAGSRWHEVATALQGLERAAKQELS
jgi:hypothetical protein